MAATDKGHTSREFERELRNLREQLLAMGGRAEQQISRAIQSITDGDEDMAVQVIADDGRIDQDEKQIDELAFLILARRQPVASDLRFLMFSLKIVTDLERIGDLAVNIAKRQKDLARYPPSPIMQRIEALGKKVIAALQGSLDAFVHSDEERAQRVIAGDVEIDTINTHVIADVLGTGADTVQDVARSLAISSVSRYLERVGDHATNIAEMVIYYVRGRDVRHYIPSDG